MRVMGTLASHVQQRTTTLAVCWHVVTLGGTEYGFTSCSRDLQIGGLLYRSNTGIEPTAVQCVCGLEVDNSEMTGFLQPGNGLDADSVRAGVLDGASVYKFLVDYTAPNDYQGKLIFGVLGEVNIKGVQFTAEIRGGSQWLAATVVPLTQATCRAAYGDAQCKATPGTNEGLVTSVTSQKLFAASGLIGARADGFFDYGYMLWTGGRNGGIKHDVRHFDQATGGFTLIINAVLPIQVGDTFRAIEGCAKTVAACKTKNTPGGGTNNIINYDGEPYLPGNDLLLRIVKAK